MKALRCDLLVDIVKKYRIISRAVAVQVCRSSQLEGFSETEASFLKRRIKEIRDEMKSDINRGDFILIIVLQFKSS